MKQNYFIVKACFIVLFLALYNGVLAQQNANRVKGVVKNQKGEVLQGVTVTVKNKDSSIIATTATNASGVFSVNNLQPGNSYTFIFSHVGYQSQASDYQYTGGDIGNLSFQLSPAGGALEEVVVVGYGTQKKINLTGAVDQVSGDVLENRPIPNLSQGLQGVIPNLNIRLGDGKPIQAPAYNVRGTTSIGQGGSALVLIDGVEGDPSMINPAIR